MKHHSRRPVRDAGSLEYPVEDARIAIADLERVIEDINATGYGLTLGIYTRIISDDPRLRFP